MKQLELSPQLKDLIKSRVGEDVDADNVAVFESISLNTLPLIGKQGTIWEAAVATPLTLRQIADHINGGGHIPLILDHDMSEIPTGRVFDAGLAYGDQGDFELRTLFYLDASEGKLITKINAGSVDEVSISFLPTQYLCSECDFDYLGDGANYENFYERTCGNGHTIGTDGVHLRMVGLASLVELSLVARGAVDNPKIVGRSRSKLAPATAQRLAARGFEIDGLVVQASRGEDRVDTTKLTTDLIDAKTEVGVLKAAATTFDAQLSAANTARDEARAQVATLTAERDAAITERDEARGASRTEEADAAVAYLTTVLTKLNIAGNKSNDALPTTVAELTAAIDAETQGLTTLIPTGGSNARTVTTEEKPAVSLGAFKTNRR